MIKGSPSSDILHIDIDVRMCQEQWNHDGSMAVKASGVQEGPAIFIHYPVDAETRILSDQLSQLLRISLKDSQHHCLLKDEERKEKMGGFNTAPFMTKIEIGKERRKKKE